MSSPAGRGDPPRRPAWRAGRRRTRRPAGGGRTVGARGRRPSTTRAGSGAPRPARPRRRAARRPRSTVSLRAAPLPGPAPAAKTTASAPATTANTLVDGGGLQVEHGGLHAVDGRGRRRGRDCGRCRRRCRRGRTAGGRGDGRPARGRRRRRCACRRPTQGGGRQGRGALEERQHRGCGEARRRRPGPGPAPGRPGCRSPATGAACPGRRRAASGGRRGRRASGAARRAAAAATAARRAAVRQTPSRSGPGRRRRRPGRRRPEARAELGDRGGGQERQVAGQHGDDVGRDAGEAGPQCRHRAAAGWLLADQDDVGRHRLGRAHDDAARGVGDRVEHGGEHRAAADLAAAAWPARRAGPPFRRPAPRPCTAAAGPRRHRRAAAWVPSCSWDESPAGHRCCGSAGGAHHPARTPSPPRSRWRSGWAGRRWRSPCARRATTSTWCTASSPPRG